MNNDTRRESSEVITLIHQAPENYWAGRFFPNLLRSAVVILLPALLILAVNTNVHFGDLLPFLFFILLIPIYKLFINEQDNIHIITLDRTHQSVAMHWTRRGKRKDIIVAPIDKVKVRLQQLPFSRSGNYLNFTVELDTRIETIKQFNNSTWTKAFMESAVKEFVVHKL